LHGDLKEEVYMVPPKGIPISHSNIVCKLNKSLYGLKQASRMWFEKLSTFLKFVGFVQSGNDHSLFVRNTLTSYIAVLIYVDDLIICYNNLFDSSFKSMMHNKFRIKDLGELKYFLGLEIARSKLGISIS
jgi:hypothetical protein